MSKPLSVLEPHEVTALMAWFQHNDPVYDREHAGRRNYLMFLLMLDTGIRVGELVQLRLSDLWINGEPVDSLVVRPEIAKGNHERTIPISSRLDKAIRHIIECHWHWRTSDSKEFVFAKYFCNQHLTTRQVQRIITNAGYGALNRKVTPHMLRHTFATRLMRQTNIRVVQELLGHRHLTSTQIYTHPNHADLKKAIDGL